MLFSVSTPLRTLRLSGATLGTPAVKDGHAALRPWGVCDDMGAVTARKNLVAEAESICRFRPGQMRVLGEGWMEAMNFRGNVQADSGSRPSSGCAAGGRSGMTGGGGQC